MTTAYDPHAEWDLDDIGPTAAHRSFLGAMEAALKNTKDEPPFRVWTCPTCGLTAWARYAPMCHKPGCGTRMV